MNHKIENLKLVFFGIIGYNVKQKNILENLLIPYILSCLISNNSKFEVINAALQDIRYQNIFEHNIRDKIAYN